MKTSIVKRLLTLALCLGLAASLAGCGKGKTAPAEEPAETAESAEPEEVDLRGSWAREGYYQDEKMNYLSIVFMEAENATGWYVSCMFDDGSYAGIIPLEDDVLKGTIPGVTEGELDVELVAEGEDGVMLTVGGKDVYHFTTLQDDAEIIVYVDIDGEGMLNYAKSDELIEFDDYPYDYAEIEMNEPATYVLGIEETDPDWTFAYWVRNDEEYSTDKTILVELTEDEEIVAVFDYIGEEEEE